MGLEYSPEEYGLQIVGSAGYSYYEWNLFIVFQDPETGQLFWGADSGCSCNGFMEDRGREDLSTGSVQDCRSALSRWLEDYPDEQSSAVELLAKLAALR